MLPTRPALQDKQAAVQAEARFFAPDVTLMTYHPRKPHQVWFAWDDAVNMAYFEFSYKIPKTHEEAVVDWLDGLHAGLMLARLLSSDEA